jgi:hypothetical protein
MRLARSRFLPAVAPVALPAVLVAILVAGCETLQPPPPPAAPQPPSVAQLWERPPERALLNGLRFYEDGALDRAEASFRSALLQGLRDRRDAASAHKYLAFIACAFNRLPECEQQFRNALAADPSFLLTDAEIGHPIWGPVYRRVTAERRSAGGGREPGDAARPAETRQPAR